MTLASTVNITDTLNSNATSNTEESRLRAAVGQGIKPNQPFDSSAADAVFNEILIASQDAQSLFDKLSSWKQSAEKTGRKMFAEYVGKKLAGTFQPAFTLEAQAVRSALNEQSYAVPVNAQ